MRSWKARSLESAGLIRTFEDMSQGRASGFSFLIKNSLKVLKAEAGMSDSFMSMLLSRMKLSIMRLEGFESMAFP